MPAPAAASRPDLRLGLVLAAAAAVALGTTRLAPHIAPSVTLLVASAVLMTAALAIPEARSKAIAVAAAALAGLAGSGILLRPGMPQVHDPDHVWGLWAYARAVHAGSVFPTWIPDLVAGMPLLRFYGPVTFLLALPGVLAGWAPVALWKEAMTQASVLAALATFVGARSLGAGRRGALLAACAMAFAPWRLTLFDYRGALGEATALATAPLVIAFALAGLREPTRRNAWWLGLATAILIPTHLITLFCVAVALVPAAMAQEIVLRREGPSPLAPASRRVAAVALPVLLATGVVAAWLIPAVVEAKSTSLPLQTETHRYFVYDEHGLGVSDLAMRRGWDRLRSSLKQSDRAAGREGQQMPFYVGAVLFGAALAAPWWSRSRRTWAPAAGAAAALLFTTSPAAELMSHLPAIHKLQFPWRFLTAATIFAAFAVGLGVTAVLESRQRWTRLIPVLALPALLVADAAPYAGAAGWLPPYHGLTHWVMAPDASPDDPFDVRMRPVPQDPPAGPDPVRVVGLYLPPEDTATPLALFWIRYVEWTTPPIYRGFLKSRTPEDWAEGGVSLLYGERREQPYAIAGKPYATLARAGTETDAGRVTRAAGRAALRTEVPEGGATLVVREQAFPGWIATVDGRPAPTSTTALGFLSLELPAGTHDVSLSFTQRTPARRAGWIVTALSIAAVVALRKRGHSLFSCNFREHRSRR